MELKFISLSGHLPSYATDGASGLDLRAFTDEPITLAPMERRLIPTGLFVQIPDGYEGQVRARSGLAIKQGIGLVNSIGTIDSDYRGEKGSVSTQYANLHETDEKFYIPDNVYIIGTMNDIDRSVDTFDFAMRRRFRFVEVTAESQLYILDKELGECAEEAKTRLRNLNAAIENVQELNSHYHIGPSYFCELQYIDFDYELLWSDYLKPLLEDYVRGSYDEAETLETLKNAFDLTKNEQTEPQDTGDNDADH